MFNLILSRFAQADSSELTQSPEEFTTGPVTSEPVVSENAGNIMAGLGIIALIMALLGMVSFVFFILALIHLIKHPDVPNRTLWIILSIIIPFAGLVYFIGPRRSFAKSSPSAGVAPQNPQTSQAGLPPQTFGNPPTAPQTPASPSFGDTQPTPFTPPTVTPSAPPLAAAPANPIQVPPPNPNFSTTNNFEPVVTPPQSYSPSPDVVAPQPATQDVVPSSSQDDTTNPFNEDQNRNNQA